MTNEALRHVDSKISSNIQDLVTYLQYKTWFKTLSLHSFSENTYTFSVPTNFLRDWITKYYIDILKKAIQKVTGVEEDLIIKIETNRLADTADNRNVNESVDSPLVHHNVNDELHEEPKADEVSFFDQGQYDKKREKLFLNPSYAFNSFVIGPGNQLTYAASLAVAENPSTAYNPLFLHGSSGLGKTHLLHAICHIALKQKTNINIALISCETFINNFISSIEKNDLDTFRSLYRSKDILLIDDIHLLANKERTQEEFFHTFNSLFNHGKQIVITSDSYPSEIPTLEERMVSRFKWGLVTQIMAPDFETRCAIIKKKSKSKGHNIPNDVIAYLAENIDTNIRELEGAITKVVGYSVLMNCRLDLEMAKEAMKDVIKSRKSFISIDEIVKITIDKFNVKLSDLQSKKRNQSIAVPRQIAMYLAKELTKHSLQEIGAYFGGRDSSTVLHACNKITNYMNSDTPIKIRVDEIAKECSAC